MGSLQCQVAFLFWVQHSRVELAANVKSHFIEYGLGSGYYLWQGVGRYGFAPPLGSSALKFCPPYPSVPIHIRVKLLEVMLVMSALHIMANNDIGKKGTLARVVDMNRRISGGENF